MDEFTREISGENIVKDYRIGKGNLKHDKIIELFALMVSSE